MFFLLREFIKVFKTKLKKKKKIGFIIHNTNLYTRVEPSIRLRAYDIINIFAESSCYFLELFKFFRKYDLVIFVKVFDEIAYQKALDLSRKGTKIVLDINTNIFNPNCPIAKQREKESVVKFIPLCDAIITTSLYLQQYIQNQYPTKLIHFLPEPIHSRYFKKLKLSSSTTFTFIWSGYVHKAKALLLLRDILVDLYQQYNFQIIVISQSDPELDFGSIPIVFKKYELKKICHLLTLGDVFIAPRDLTIPYNLGHSFTKIGVVMAAGIPVIADPIPAYLNAPVISCHSLEEWREKLRALLAKEVDLGPISQAGRLYCQQYYGHGATKRAYEDFFKQLIIN